MGRQQDAGIAFGEIHLNHGASILNRLFARVDGRGIMSHLGRSRRSPGWIGTAAVNAWCKIAATRGTNDTFLPNLAIGKVRPGSRDRMGNKNSQILRGPILAAPERANFWRPGVASPRCAELRRPAERKLGLNFIRNDGVTGSNPVCGTSF